MTAPTEIHGTVLAYGDEVNTDVLHPSRFFSLDQLTVRRGFAEGAGAEPDGAADAVDDAARFTTPRIIVAGSNFGYGSSRETTIQSIKLNGIAAVVAASISRIFWRNAVNAGLAVLEVADAPRALAGHERLRVDVAAGTVRNDAGAVLATGTPPDAYDLSVLAAGGILAWLNNGSPVRP